MLQVHSKSATTRTPRMKKSSEEEEETMESQHTLSEEHISTVNVSHIGTDAEVQLAEALVAVSESMIGPEDAMETAHVVAVETSSQDNDDQVKHQTYVVVIGLARLEPGNSFGVIECLQYTLFVSFEP